MAPFGDPHVFFNPSRFTWSAVGVIVGSLNIAFNLNPAVTTSFNTWSFVSSLFFALKSKCSHFEVSTAGAIHFSLTRSITYFVISSPATYTIGAATKSFFSEEDAYDRAITLDASRNPDRRRKPVVALVAVAVKHREEEEEDTS